MLNLTAWCCIIVRYFEQFSSCVLIVDMFLSYYCHDKLLQLPFKASWPGYVSLRVKVEVE